MKGTPPLLDGGAEGVSWESHVVTGLYVNGVFRGVSIMSAYSYGDFECMNRRRELHQNQVAGTRLWTSN